MPEERVNEGLDSIQMNLFDYFMDEPQFTTKEATKLVTSLQNVNKESVRARIYEGVARGIFEKVSRGVYQVKSQIEGIDNNCLLINGDGRDLSMIPDNSIDAIITDHPYDLSKALSGGNRKFATYELFKYNRYDFEEKQRVMKQGCFLVEFLPEESALNYDYLYNIKKMAKECGFNYFAKVPWKKGNFIANTGRKAKNIEDIMIFSKGEPRALKLDAKKNLAIAREHGIDIPKGMSSYDVQNILEDNGIEVARMKGTNGMLPTEFNYQPRNKKDKIMEAEKPIELLEAIIEYTTLKDELILDQFAGSGNIGVASMNKGRDAILIEKNDVIFNKMKHNVETHHTKNISSRKEKALSDVNKQDKNKHKSILDKQR